MMLLVSLAISVAFLASAASALGLFDLEFWWELSALVVIMLRGHWQEMKALGQARGEVSAPAELLPDEAERVRDGETERVSLAELEPGDVVLVRAGRPRAVDLNQQPGGLTRSPDTHRDRPASHARACDGPPLPCT